MSSSDTSPGPIADRVFESGFRLATIGGLAGVACLHWIGALSLFNPVTLVLTLLLFPVYLVAVAILLGAWLGYDTDAMHRRSVGDETEPSDPWEHWRW